MCIWGTGHFLIILSASSGKAGGESVVITFDPHPRVSLSGKTGGPFFLSTLDEKKKLLAESGIDHLIIMNFTRAAGQIWKLTTSSRQILVEKIGTRHLMVGYDNHFGKGKGGDFKKICE